MPSTDSNNQPSNEDHDDKQPEVNHVEPKDKQSFNEKMKPGIDLATLAARALRIYLELTNGGG